MRFVLHETQGNVQTRNGVEKVNQNKIYAFERLEII